METKIENSSIPEKPKTFLNDYERQILEKGVKKLYAELNKLPPDTLPQIILIPDTGARPLVYAIKPIINKIYTNKGQPQPNITFIVENKQNRLDRSANDTCVLVETLLEAIITQKDLRAVYRRKHWSDDEIEQAMGIITANLTWIGQAEKEVQKKFGGTQPTRFLVVDDWAGGGTTLAFADNLIALYQRNRGLSSVDMDNTRSFFVFGSSFEFDRSFPWSAPARRNMWIGSYHEDRTGFLFRFRHKSAIGVEKISEPPYHVRRTDRNTQQMRALWREIEQVARETIETM